MSDRYYLIGTAGHVDHGKTQLVKALTGIETDRLKEEKERGISIELGFAYLTLPSGRKAGIVDVPGHEKFVRQMLAGASGMDIVLLVIAADEGVMPQTREHLDILNLLQIEKGMVVLTKIDLVDEEWLTLVEQDIREKLKGSFLQDAPICKVAAVTGEGIPGLLDRINEILEDVETRRTDLPARMPVDRVFTIQGHGTVVTGTLHSGILHKGQDILVEPGGPKAKIRNIQVHGAQVEAVSAGQRAAINLSGLTVGDIDRGANLAEPGYFQAGQILDVQLSNLAGEKRQITQRQRVHFHLGTAEILGRIHLLAQEELAPGETSLAQVILERPVLAVPGDRFVIRYYSPVTTIGGGKVLGIAPQKRKRFRSKVLEELSRKAQGDPKELLIEQLTEPMTIEELLKTSSLGQEELEQFLASLRDDDKILILCSDHEDCYWSWDAAEKLADRASREAEKYQLLYPLKGGIGREELKRKLNLQIPLKLWQMILEWGAEKGYFRLTGNHVEKLPELKLPDKIRKQLDCLHDAWEAAGLNPPEWQQSCIACGFPAEKFPDYVAYLLAKGLWVKVGEYYFASEAIEQAKQTLGDYLHQRGQVTVAEVRDLWQTSRKYAVPLLEYFDSIRFTKRVDLIRVLYK